MSYADGRRAAAVDELFATGAEVGRAWADAREQRKADKQFQADYAAAVIAAQQTGAKLERRFQRDIAEDDAVDAVGIKAVLLRELAKLDPNHPLVKKECRKAVADVTRIKFNRAGRPTDRIFDEFAPDEAELQRIMDHYGQ